nr:unnamed protein product [Callosobruchus chinensis]
MEIEALCDNFEEQLSEREQFEQDFESSIALATELLETHSENDADSNNDSSVKSDIVIKSSNIVLPQISLPKFSGIAENWLEYRSTFETLIHCNEALNNLQMFHYLKASLEGTASQVIRPIQFTAENYGIAWSAICDEFNNSKLLIHEHVRALFQLEPIKEASADLKRLINDVSQHLTCLEMLGESKENLGNLLLIYLVKTKLDSLSTQEWEKEFVVDEMKGFLKERATILETTQVKHSDNKDKYHKFKDKKYSSKSLVSNTYDISAKKYTCNYCNECHSIYNCQSFAKLSPQERLDHVKKAKLCKICLLDRHNSRNCKQGPCRKSRRYHNSLLHIEVTATEVSNTPNEKDNKTETTSLASGVSLHVSNNQVLLSTAKVWVKGKQSLVEARLLLDSASQTSFITNDLCKRLNLEKTKTNLSVFGISNVKSLSQFSCEVEIQSKTGNFKTKLKCYTLLTITSYTPNFSANINNKKIPSNIILADPEFHTPAAIGMLLGGEIFWDLLCQGKISLGKNKPVLKETSLGWIIAGQIGGSRPDSGVSNVCLNTELNNQLQKFWEIEEWHQEKIMSDEEAYCEANFKETTYRDENGRFVVSMPLKLAPELLGESRTIAESRLRSMEKRFAKNENLASSYLEFMAEYREMSHMSLVSSDTLQRENDSSIYYTPHHAVLKEQSETTKLRVVFDASAPTSTNMSLNQIQCVGPIVQDELISIILRFRKHNVVMSADVAKMYRMIVMNPSHRGLQRILWRDSPDQDIQTYELNTVTYRQACSSFPATRCLVEISENCKSDLPRVSNILKHDFYIDDICVNREAITAAKDISKKLSEYGFVLRKWQSNDQTFLLSISSDSIEHSVLNFDSNKSTKILGLTWTDASERAYGACIYIVSGYGQHKQSRLLCAKSKLAPLKTITMPLLELCAALLLSRLYDKVLKGFHQNFNEVFLWSDTTIVLAWVKMSSNGLKIFVANRVTEIQNLTKGYTWRHVSSSENPADLLSRGLRPKEIVNRSLWWEGPKWLCDNPNTWPNSTCIVQELPELKVSVNIASTPSVEFPYNRFSNFNRLRRSVAWILRFKSNVMLPPDARASGPLSNQEL